MLPGREPLAAHRGTSLAEVPEPLLRNENLMPFVTMLVVVGLFAVLTLGVWAAMAYASHVLENGRPSARALLDHASLRTAADASMRRA